MTRDIDDDWNDFVVSEINDHVVRLSVLQRDFHWHLHKNSDELFFVIEGKLFVDPEDRTEEIGPGQMITIPKNVRHRTSLIYRQSFCALNRRVMRLQVMYVQVRFQR